jgi:hypothetical protein
LPSILKSKVTWPYSELGKKYCIQIDDFLLFELVFFGMP